MTITYYDQLKNYKDKNKIQGFIGQSNILIYVPDFEKTELFYSDFSDPLNFTVAVINDKQFRIPLPVQDFNKCLDHAKNAEMFRRLISN